MIEPEARRAACADLRERFRYDSRELSAVRDCPACGASNSIQIADSDRYGFPAQFALCIHCGLVYSSPRLTEKGYLELYREFYRPLVGAYWDCDMSVESVAEDSAAYAKDLWGWLKRYCPSAKGHRIVDIGGGTGITCQFLREEITAHGGKVELATVVDPSETELELANKMGLKSICATAETVELPDRLTLVLLCRTLDHCWQPGRVLRKVREALANHAAPGLVYLDIVDWQYVFRAEGTGESFHLDHPSNFTRQTVLALLNRSGLSVIAERLRPGRTGHTFLCRAGRPDWSHVPQTTFWAEELFFSYRQCQADENRRAGIHPLRPRLGRRG